MPDTYLYNAAIFLSTPSGWRATFDRSERNSLVADFYPRPPGGGRQTIEPGAFDGQTFLSTPSGWRATCPVIARF